MRYYIILQVLNTRQINCASKSSAHITHSRSLSALIATAYTIVGRRQRFHLSSIKLSLPPDVLTNLETKLLIYLEAIEISGYVTHKTRKVFVIGNTGRSNFNYS